MSDPNQLTDEEREELEQLRAEKARREQARRAAADRDELERLKAERAQAAAEAAEDERIAAIKARGREIMEPDEDDLRMPVGQKIVIAAVFITAIAFVLMTVLGH